MKLLVAGGGTGGHLFPGIAIADEVKRRGGEVLFVGTARGLETRVVPAAGYPLELLQVSGLKRMRLSAQLRGLMRLPAAFMQSLRILRRFRPDVVLGVGGYASGPLVMTAALTGYPTAIQEQNSVPGFTNRVLSRFARAVFVAFEDAEGAFPRGKCARLGNPVRSAFQRALAAPDVAVPLGRPRLLVVGGSQGARAVNDLVLDAMQALATRGQAPLLVHQTGATDCDRISAAYHELGLGDSVTVQPFIDDMVAAYRAADVVVGRAGALTLAELAMVGRPAILIPLPTAADDHQTKNAAALARFGAAVIVDQRTSDGERLAGEIAGLLADADRRAAMAAAMRAAAHPDAARLIVDRLDSLIARP